MYRSLDYTVSALCNFHCNWLLQHVAEVLIHVTGQLPPWLQLGLTSSQRRNSRHLCERAVLVADVRKFLDNLTDSGKDITPDVERVENLSKMQRVDQVILASNSCLITFHHVLCKGNYAEQVNTRASVYLVALMEYLATKYNKRWHWFYFFQAEKQISHFLDGANKLRTILKNSKQLATLVATIIALCFQYMMAVHLS